jgi:potassium-transporting ATPase KdpC subunit
MKDHLRMTIISLTLLTLIFGFIYPLALCLTGEIFFSHHSHGSILKNSSNHAIGSKFIGQNFTTPQYFHPRPSFAGESGYDAMASDASNLGPTSKKLHDLLQERIAIYRIENNLPSTEPIPTDAVTASGSGLDPHISLPNAYLQAHRIAQTRNIPIDTLREIIRKNRQTRWLGIFGEERVNVLLINLELDRRFP